jgi:hypothetical protein
MALLDIVTTSGQSPVLAFDRGDVGTVLDAISNGLSEFVTPRLGVGQVFPSVGDVDNGVTYGPTGADYTGTLEQPTEADVLVGVQYGAGGTEFTGTATGGGGGFISIINE